VGFLISSPAKAIKTEFNKLKARKMLPTLEEIQEQDRKDFDLKVLLAYGRESYQKSIYEVLEQTINERVNQWIRQ